MINLALMPKIVAKKVKNLGRGEGSGRGKTAGRGTKGQKARGKIPVSFEGGQLALTKRLPLYRGRGRNKPMKQKTQGVNLKDLNVIPKDTKVTREVLIKYHLISKDTQKSIKILGEGNLLHPLTICLPTSHKAKAAIEKAEGTVELPVLQKPKK